MRVVGATVAAAVLALAAAGAQAPGRGVPRTADGKPDLQGNWTNATITPLERLGQGRPLVITEEQARDAEGQSERIANQAIWPDRLQQQEQRTRARQPDQQRGPARERCKQATHARRLSSERYAGRRGQAQRVARRATRFDTAEHDGRALAAVVATRTERRRRHAGSVADLVRLRWVQTGALRGARLRARRRLMLSYAACTARNASAEPPRSGWVSSARFL